MNTCPFCGKQLKRACKGSCGPKCPGPVDKASTLYEECEQQKDNVLQLMASIDSNKATDRLLGMLDGVCEVLTQAIKFQRKLP